MTVELFEISCMEDDSYARSQVPAELYTVETRKALYRLLFSLRNVFKELGIGGAYPSLC